MRPEERALELQSCMRIISDPIKCRALIAQAIRQAENEAYDRAYDAVGESKNPISILALKRGV